MSKLKGVKTGAFKVTPDNKNQTFGIQSDGESFRCVVPAPVHDFFESSYCSELEAWKAIIMFRVKIHLLCNGISMIQNNAWRCSPTILNGRPSNGLA